MSINDIMSTKNKKRQTPQKRFAVTKKSPENSEIRCRAIQRYRQSYSLQNGYVYYDFLR